MKSLLLAFTSTAILGAAPAVEFHLSPQGKDADPGSVDKPFATLARAQKAVRESKARGKAPVTVILHSGTYYLAATLVLGHEDSGAAGAPVTWKAADGEEAVVSGGERIALKWEPF